MLLAALQGINKFYGDQTVLQDAALEIRSGARIALIGRNGSGKTTILRLLMGLEQADGGNVFLRPGVTAAMLEQDPKFGPSERVSDVSKRAFADLTVMEEGLAKLEEAGLDDPARYERWEALHETFERRGGYERRARRDAVLYALGFRGREEEEAAHLSGGEKTRLGLARLLMAQPDLLLLDEPTNHLDIEMRAWLEGYLGRYQGGVLLVSHDRAFLDAACDGTTEVSLGKLRSFAGNPSGYWAYRAEGARLEEATRANEAKELDRLETMTQRMHRWAGQNAKLHRRAKAMQKRVGRFKEDMLGEAEGEERNVRFRFSSEESAEVVLQARHLGKGFDGETLFDGVHLTVRAGERIALVGPNGAGKSTFLKVLLGDLPSDDPAALRRFGVRVRVGYYDQELRGVSPERTLIEELIRLVGDREAHNLLGRFLFPYDAQYKKVADLSGGERARLALLKLTLGEYNFLVLDEPTNHLDLEMIEALEAALGAFEGTLLIVSHDRRFIEATTDLVWELRGGVFSAYEGDWEFYERKRRVLAVEAPPPASPAKAGKLEKAGPSKWQLARDLESLEAQIADLEVQLAGVTARLAEPQGLDHQALAGYSQAHVTLEAELLCAMAAWEETTERLVEKETAS
ncbi:MAG: ABC-F family ATP-binding cassette domain-containing protein [Deinococcota bacterium]|nr:ABC-F family ATP-binding cassette domain-containing protein [Deinococcota bacterium]